MNAHRISPTLIAKTIPIMDKIMLRFEQEVIDSIKTLQYNQDKIYIPIFSSSLLSKEAIFSRIPPIYIGFDYVNAIDEYDGIEDMVTVSKEKVKPIYADGNGAYLILPFV